MNSTMLLNEARQRALDILQHCATEHGFRASALAEGYPQIWARDAIITFLGAAATGDPTLIASGRASLSTMSAHQSRLGLIQLNVNPDTGYVSTENAGALDGNLWYILGHYLYFKLRGDRDFLRERLGLTGTHVGCEHGVCGAWGTLAAGLFNAGGTSLGIIGVQLVGILAAFVGPELAVRGRALFETEYAGSFLLLAGSYFAGLLIISSYRDIMPEASDHPVSGRSLAEILNIPNIVCGKND